MSAQATGALGIALTGPMGITPSHGVEVHAKLGRLQTRVVFAALVIERERPTPVDELAEIVWPDQLPATWSTALRGAVSRVRSFLTAAGAGVTITSGAGCYQLQLPDDAVVDVEEVPRLLAEAATALERGAAEGPGVALAAVRAALEISSRPFLPDARGPWAEAQRERLHHSWLRAMELESASHLAGGDHRLAADRARELVAAAPFLEPGHRLLIRSLRAAGDRPAALQAYAGCRRLLAQELGVAPSPETEALHLEVLGETTSPSFELPFVGRDAEMAELAAAWRDVSDGGRQLAVVTGSAGSGKSRLVAELASRIRAAGGIALLGRADPLVRLPFRAFAQALVGGVDDERASAIRGRVGPSVSSEIDQLCDAPDDPDDPLAARSRRFEAVARWLDATADDGPVLLAVEDAHWAPLADLALLQHVVDHPRLRRLLVLVTTRPLAETVQSGFGGALGHLCERDGIHVTLRGLDVGAVAEIVQQVDTGGAAWEAVAEVVHRRTGGNPLFVRQLLAHVLVGKDPLHAATQVPAALVDLLRLRVADLGPAVGDLLTTAALDGDDIDLALLSAIHGDHDLVAEAVDRAAAVGLVEAKPTGGVRFTHSLVRESIALGAGPGARLHRHGAIAEALMARSDSRRHTARIARHCRAAVELEPGEARRALDLSAMAAAEAASQGAYEDAVAEYEHALALVEPDDHARRCDVLIALGDATHRAGDASYRTLLERAARDAQALHDGVRLARIAAALSNFGFPVQVAAADELAAALATEALSLLPPQAAAERSRMCTILAETARWSGQDPRRAVTLAEEAVELARRAGADTALADALVGRRTIVARRPQDLLLDAEELLASSERTGSEAAAWHGHGLAFEGHLQLGDMRRADAALAAADEVADRLAVPYFRWVDLERRAGRAVLAGELAQAEPMIEAVRESAGDVGLHESMAVSGYSALMLVLRLHQGRPLDALPALDLIGTYAADDPSWRASRSLLLSAAGQLDAAAADVAAVTSRGLRDIVDDELGIGTAMSLARTAWVLGDSVTAALVLPRLADRTGTMSWLACFSLGPVDLALATCTRLLGDDEGALRHLAVADHLCRRAAAPLWREEVRLIDGLIRRDRGRGSAQPASSGS